MRAPKLRFLMTPASHLRYLAWRAAPLSPSIIVALKSGEKLCLRRLPSTDPGVAYEVFARDLYRGRRAPETGSVKRIADLGANVGISVVYWAHRYPAARIDAYEPHPVCGELLIFHRNQQFATHRSADGYVNLTVIGSRPLLDSERPGSRSIFGVLCRRTAQ